MTNNQKQKLKELHEKYNLDKETDFWSKTLSGKTFIIVARTGIEKIQAAEQISVDFEALVVGQDYAAIKGIGTKGGQRYVSFGSALKGQGGNCFTSYVLEMAEKRALARVILKMIDFYQHGVFSEDESRDFERKVQFQKV
tara:strand:- start:225 stop:644 length:420 start_codon:yes stop_codon:yes gene_type:complete